MLILLYINGIIIKNMYARKTYLNNKNNKAQAGKEFGMNPDNVIAIRSGKVVYRSGEKCIKVFDESYSKQDVLNEALNQARVEETGLRIPKILEVTMVDGKWAIVTEFIEGKTLAHIMADDPDNKDKYIELLVDLQLEVHSKTCPLLNKLKDNMSRKVCLTDLDATTRYDLYTRLDSMPKHNKICHGDFHPANIIITEDGTPYIIDWSHATQGNASADAAITYLNFRLADDTEGAKKYLALFCKKSNISEEYVQKWLPIAAAAQSINANNKDREFLLSCANETDYE